MGVLASGKYDDGVGLTRANVAKHKHEKFSGFTSSVNEQVCNVNNKNRLLASMQKGTLQTSQELYNWIGQKSLNQVVK